MGAGSKEDMNVQNDRFSVHTIMATDARIHQHCPALPSSYLLPSLLRSSSFVMIVGII